MWASAFMKGISKMNVGEFCFLDIAYYRRFNDPHLMHIQECGTSRPFFYTFKDTFYPDIFWMVPVSRAGNKNGKYQTIIAKKKARYGRCDTIILGHVLGQQAAFLIQNMCPVTEQYITNTYIQKANNQPVSIRKSTQIEIETAAKRIWKRVKERTEREIKAGLPVSRDSLVCPDIFSIYQELVKDLNT